MDALLPIGSYYTGFIRADNPSVFYCEVDPPPGVLVTPRPYVSRELPAPVCAVCAVPLPRRR